MLSDEEKKAKRAAYVKAYREANRDKWLAQKKEYREKNAEKIKAYKEANKDRDRARAKARYQSKAEQRAEKKKLMNEKKSEEREAKKEKRKTRDAWNRHFFYLANKDKLLAADKREREALADCYVACKLGINVKDCPPELLELKREQLRINRLTKQLNNALREKDHE